MTKVCKIYIVYLFVVLTVWLMYQSVDANNNNKWQMNSVSDDTVPITSMGSQIHMKSPTGAVIRSLIIPGWGQHYNEKYIKSVLVFCAETSMITGILCETILINEYWDKYYDTGDTLYYDLYIKHFYRRENLYWWLAGIVFMSVMDAYVDAHLYRFDEQTTDELSYNHILKFNLSKKKNTYLYCGINIRF